MQVQLGDKKAIVTGAGRGIGRGMALALAEHGADVLIADINLENAESVAGEIEGMGRKSVALKVDVTKEDDTTKMASVAVDVFGSIDIQCNNAGIVSMCPVKDLTVEEWDRMFDVNAKGVFLCTRASLPQMLKQPSAKIINTASQAGKIAWPLIGHYCASKAAVISFTKACALELAPKILVNAVCPGTVYTDMTKSEIVWASEIHSKDQETIRKEYLDVIPLQRFAEPEDIAKVVVFLASDYSNYMTGQAVNVSGGQTMH
jgi:NAD(P)-dependent dehydrogenase (short-subunit alcohol dehydrogenase family)